MTYAPTIVIGAGLRGMTAALERLRVEPDHPVLVVDAAPEPGGGVRSSRSNGFVCELGAFAFAATELRRPLAALDRPPRAIEARAEARTGWLFDGERRHPIPVEPVPCSFRSGSEEVVQACRMALGERLRLGRPVTAIEPDGTGLVVVLGGEVPQRVAAAEVVLAAPRTALAAALTAFDGKLGDVAARMAYEPRAMVFLGGAAGDAAEVSGYGVVPADGLAGTLQEVIFCTEVFDGRALPGRFLWRAELAGDLGANDDEVLGDAMAQIRAWTGLASTPPFRRLHRFRTPATDGAAAEALTRIGALLGYVPGLTEAPPLSPS